jgi:two-component sensor histidine kinase
MPAGGDELDTIGAAIDGFMDELNAARAQRDLLEAEMGHRIKNVLAMVQGIALQTFRKATSTSEALSTFSKRLSAIGEAFTALGGDRQAASLMDVVKATVAPFEDPSRPQFTVSGPDIRIGSKATLAIAMALHELGTNAVKYGALAQPNGRVVINWAVKGEELTFRWSEQDGPAVVPPEKNGFGSQMMEKVLSSETGANVHVVYAATGLKYEFRAPVGQLTA